MYILCIDLSVLNGLIAGAETRETPTAVLVNSAVVSVAVSSLIVLNLT